MRSLTAVVDALAVKRADDTWVKIPKTGRVEDGFQNITWFQLAEATDRLAHWMVDECGLRDQTIAYTGINDIRYVVVLLAAMKVGCKLLLTSARNSEEGQMSLLQSTGAAMLLHSPELSSSFEVCTQLKSRFRMKAVPDLAALLTLDDLMPPFIGREYSDPSEKVLILHSSGSTGLPKPIYLTQGSLSVMDNIRSMPAAAGRRHLFGEVFKSRPMLSMMPFFHIMGVTLIARSIFHQGPLILLPPTSPPTADMIIKVIEAEKPSSAVFAPSMLSDICALPGGLEALAQLEDVFYGGAPLERSCGNKVSLITNLRNGIGSTETMNVPSYIGDREEDWEYYEWDESAGVVLEPVGSGLSELVIQRVVGRNDQFVFHNFPELTEWRSKDVFERHPSRPELWRHAGRLDDTLVFSNGEKFAPAAFQAVVTQHSMVGSVLMIGSGRFQSSLLLQPASSMTAGMDDEQILNHVWPYIEQANADAPAYSRVFKSMVIMTKSDKPLVKNPKGAVMRNASTKLYEEEIEALYAVSGWKNEMKVLNTSAKLDEVQSMVRDAFSIVLPGFIKETNDEQNIFTFGIDSLLIQRLSQVLKQALPSKPELVSNRAIYNNPTVISLSLSIHNGLIERTTPGMPSISREQVMSAMTHRHTKDLPKPSAPQLLPQTQHTILLTGSTGALGTHILSALLADPVVTHIYCFDRSAKAQAHQTRIFNDRSVQADFSRVTFLHGNLTSPSFALNPAVHRSLASEVTAIIHNAWPVNFNLPLSAFEPSIAGVRALVDFSAHAILHPHILFVSSIASTGNWNAVREGLVPERWDGDNSLPMPNGYGESKHVASAVLARAAVNGSNSTVVRVGQLAGPRVSTGIWNKQEWLPSLIATSAALGKIPASLGVSADPVSWLPIDDAAAALVSMLKMRLREQGQPSRTLNLVKPKSTEWSELLPAVSAYYCDKGVTLEIVSFEDWLSALEEVPRTEKNLATHPALKLLEVLGDMVAAERVDFETSLTQRYAPALAESPAIDAGMMSRWMEGWAFGA